MKRALTGLFLLLLCLAAGPVVAGDSDPHADCSPRIVSVMAALGNADSRPVSGWIAVTLQIGRAHV